MARILGASLFSAMLLAACASGPGSSFEQGSSSPAAPSAGAPSISPTSSPSPGPTQTPLANADLLLALRAPSDNPDSAVLIDSTTGGLVDLGRADEVSWSGDGSALHVVRQGAECVPSLRTVRTDGAVIKTVTSGLRSEDRAFAWSPDGLQVAFLRFHNGPPPRMCGSMGGTYPAEELVTDVVAMAVDGSAQRVLVPGGWPRDLAWSPDGSRIAFLENVPPQDANQSRLSIVDVSTGSVRHLTEALDWLDSLAWSPDGREIRVRYPVAGTDSYHVAAVDPVSGVLHDLFIVASGSHELSWSPDGSLAAVAFDVADSGDAIVGGDVEVWTAASATKTPLQLGDVQSFGEPPAWSSDGTWLAFSRVEASGSGFGGIDIVSADGVSRRHVPDSAGYVLVSWQP